MYTYKTVLLEIEDKEALTYKERIGGFMEHDPLDKVANITNLFVSEDGLFGDIGSVKPLDGLYPSIKYVVIEHKGDVLLEGRLLAIGFCKERNLDLSIPAISQSNPSVSSDGT